MSFFWPTNRKQETTVLVRAGRVLHWTASGVAGTVALFCIFAIFENDADAGSMFAFCILAALFALAGRGLRYILAGE